jgi:hypothetical protein
MKRILIIGDSWAIIPCNIYTPQSLWHKWHLENYKDSSVLDWLDFKLLERGHSVSNRSYGGNQNWFQLGIAETFLDASIKNNFEIDIIIWFHTELLRDAHLNPELNRNKDLETIRTSGLQGLIDKIGLDTYTYATELYNKSPKTKWAIIGGHAPVIKKHKHLLSWADFMIEDWRSELLNTTIPECHTLSFFQKDWDSLREHCNLDLDVILQELQNKQLIRDICNDKEIFYDGVHPSPKSNLLLTEKLIKHFDL